MDTFLQANTVINSEFITLIKEAEMVVLKNTSNDKLIKISLTEYQLLKKYAENQSIKKTIKYGESIDVEITTEQLIKLIEIAKELNLLVSKAEMENILEIKSKNYQQEYQNTTRLVKFMYIFSFIARILKLDKVKVKQEFTGNFRLFKLLSIDISYTMGAKIIAKPIAILTLLPLLIIIFYSLLKIYDLEQIDFWGGISFNQVTLNNFEAFFILVLGMITTSLFHELAHYFVYKQLSGKTNEFGFALINYVLPIIYISTNSIYFWRRKWKKILVASAGILLDLILIFGLYSLIATHTLYKYPNYGFICLLLMFYLIFRTLININFFIPGTDGYFIFIDIFNLNNLYKRSSEKAKIVLRHFFKFNFQKVNPKGLIYTVYYLLSLLFITVSFLALVVSIIFPLFSDLLYEIFII